MPTTTAEYRSDMRTDLGTLLGHRLRAVRKALGLSQEEFAERAGSTQPRISRAERGQTFTTVKELGELIELVGGDPLDLLRVDEAPSTPVQAEIKRLASLVQDEETLHIVARILQREIEREQAADRRKSQVR